MLELVKKIKQDPAKLIYGLEKRGLLNWMKDDRYLKLIYKLTFNRRLDLSNPTAFTEKLAWYKLHWRNPLAKECADKLAVRRYVADKVGADYLVECYGCWNSFNQIEFDKLPGEFVLKPTNGSGDVVICRDKSTFDYEHARKVLGQFRKRHFSSKTKEWAYYELPYRILAERLIKRNNGTAAIYDYKIFCFHGEPKLLLVGSDRETDVKFSYFDLEWNFIPVRCGHGNNPKVPKPEFFEEMLYIARKLSEDFPHVRVDLYEEEGRVYFGELTFYHYGGITRFEPDEWDFRIGKLFHIIDIPKDQLI